MLVILKCCVAQTLQSPEGNKSALSSIRECFKQTGAGAWSVDCAAKCMIHSSRPSFYRSQLAGAFAMATLELDKEHPPGLGTHQIVS